jgi:hypothetical protein
VTDPDVVLCLDVFDVNDSVAWWGALAGFIPVSRETPGRIGERVRLRSPRIPSFELELHTCRPRPVSGCTIGSIRLITVRLADPEAAVAALATAIAPHPVIEVERAEGAITLRDSSGYHVCVRAHHPAGSACTASTPA